MATTTKTTTKSTGPSKWFPTQTQMRDPSAMERTLRRVLQLHYDLQDKFSAMSDAHATLSAQHEALKSKMSQTPPPGSGPADTQILGLRVAPVDSQTLANGATLKFNKAGGNFVIS